VQYSYNHPWIGGYVFLRFSKWKKKNCIKTCSRFFTLLPSQNLKRKVEQWEKSWRTRHHHHDDQLFLASSVTFMYCNYVYTMYFCVSKSSCWFPNQIKFYNFHKFQHYRPLYNELDLNELFSFVYGKFIWWCLIRWHGAHDGFDLIIIIIIIIIMQVSEYFLLSNSFSFVLTHPENTRNDFSFSTFLLLCIWKGRESGKKSCQVEKRSFSTKVFLLLVTCSEKVVFSLCYAFQMCFLNLSGIIQAHLQQMPFFHTPTILDSGEDVYQNRKSSKSSRVNEKSIAAKDQLQRTFLDWKRKLGGGCWRVNFTKF